MSQVLGRGRHYLDDTLLSPGALTPGPSPGGRGALGGANTIVMTREGLRPNGASDTDVRLRPPSEGAAAAETGPGGGAPPPGAPLPVIRYGARGTNVAALRQTVAAAQAHFLTGAPAVVVEDMAGRRLTVTPPVIERLRAHLSRRVPHQGARECARRLRRGAR